LLAVEDCVVGALVTGARVGDCVVGAIVGDMVVGGDVFIVSATLCGILLVLTRKMISQTHHRCFLDETAQVLFVAIQITYKIILTYGEHTVAYKQNHHCYDR
jgi:hypothetical protein